MIQRSKLKNYNFLKMTSNKRYLYKPPPTEDYSKNFCKLYIVIAISFVFIAGQFVGGYISGSISVISDAFHLVTDLIGFVVSFVFIYISRRDPTEKMSFGYHRMELIGALGNLFIIWFLAIFMIYEATLRIIQKEFVTEPKAMLIVGIAGLAINIIMYFVLHSGSHSHGLMSEQCNHHHEPHDNDPNPSNCTTSFCNELICEDEVCLKQVNQTHCHVKDTKGEEKIHIHRSDRKFSEQLDGINNLNLDQTQQNINCRENCKIQHQKKNHKHQHKHDQKNCKGHSHDHQQQHKDQNKTGPHQQESRHDRKKIINQEQKNDETNHQSSTGEQNFIELRINKNIKSQQYKHEHRQNCQHGHDHKYKNHKHDHKHAQGSKHDHEHKYDHDHKKDHKHEHRHYHGSESISMKAAVLHALSDVIQSIGLLISSFFIFFLGSDKGAEVHEWNDWHYFDPISTYIFSVIVICSTIPIVKNCYFLIMEATPSTEIARQIKREFEELPGVVDVHDLHIWSLRPGKNILIAHVFAKNGAQRQVLTRLTEICRQKKIFHSTMQVEEYDWKNHDEYILCDHDIH